MPSSRLACIMLILIAMHFASAQEEVQAPVSAPGISGIEPLGCASALVRWDVVDAAVEQVQVMVREHVWSGYTAHGTSSGASGWCVITGLQPHRHYRIQLYGTVSGDTCIPGAAFEYTHNCPIIEWMFVPGGDFVMGDTLDVQAARHMVSLSPYLLSANEVTNRQYLDFCAADSMPVPEDPDFVSLKDYVHHCPEYPVVNVTWKDATSFCNGLSRRMKLPQLYDSTGNAQSGLGVRLPTEAEWENAAGQEHGIYPWGNTSPLPILANFSPAGSDSAKSTGPVAVRSHSAAPAGLYDLAGNVWEWCQDWYAPFYDSATPPVNPTGPAHGQYKIIRGGSWADSSTTLRVSNRGRLSPEITMSTLGFRVARSYPITSPKVINATHAEEHNAQAR